jgi:hypothetical protein
MDEPDDFEAVGTLHKYLDGSQEREILGGNKHITLVVAPLATAVDRRFMVSWLLASQRLVQYGSIISGVEDEDPKLVSQWVKDCELQRMFTLRLVDTHLYHAWDDGITIDADMYYTAIVEITGTSASPQTFTTGSAPLLVDVSGNPFPNFTGKVVSVLGVAMAYSQFAYCQIGEASVVGGNAVWVGYRQDGAVPDDSGKYWIKFTISAK